MPVPASGSFGVGAKGSRPTQDLKVILAMPLQMTMPHTLPYNTMHFAWEKGSQPMPAPAVIQARQLHATMLTLASYNTLNSAWEKGR